MAMGKQYMQYKYMYKDFQGEKLCCYPNMKKPE